MKCKVCILTSHLQLDICLLIYVLVTKTTFSVITILPVYCSYVCVCKAEELDEATFLELNTSLMYQMGIRMGPALKLSKVIAELKVRKKFYCSLEYLYVLYVFFRLMMIFSCYLCEKDCFTVDDYTSHLRNRHALIEPCSLKCNAGGCRRTFSSYKALRRHMRTNHSDDTACCYNEASSPRCHVTGNAASVDYDDDAAVGSTTTCSASLESGSVPCVDNHGISQAALKFLLALMASNALPLSTIEFVKNSVQDLIRDIVGFLRSKVIKVIDSLCPDGRSVPVFQDLLTDFDGWKNPFYGIETEQQLLTYLRKKGCYNDPEPHVIGKRWEVKRDKVTKKQLQVEVDDTFYYVSIENTLRVILNQPQTLQLLDKTFRNPNCEVFSDWLDSSNGQRLQTYSSQQFSACVPIFLQVYFDEVETVNPLGSKTSIHKLGAFYFVIKNFPAAVNSSLHNIHLLALAHSADLKRYTADAVVRSVCNELIKLHDVGFSVMLNGRPLHFRCFLTQVVGDNLGLHSVLGFVENFSRATYACDLCMATQSDMQTVFNDSELQARTLELYGEHIRELASGNIGTSDCGIKRPSAFSSLQYYSPASNDAADIMHDLFEGVVPLETKLFLCHLLFQVRCISLQEINNRIKSHDYGYCGSKSKPSVLLESHLKGGDAGIGQRSAQMMMLFSTLALIVAGCVVDDTFSTQGLC